MNTYTFKDAVNSKRSSLAHDLDEDDEDEVVGTLRKPVDGEEAESAEKFNEVGEVIEPFNLKNEREAGNFDENMNFVFTKEKRELDAWVADLDEATMEKSIGEAALAMKKINAKREIMEQQEAARPKKTPTELKVELLSFMQPEESPAQAMRRISGKSTEKHGYSKKRTMPSKAATNNNNTQASKENRDVIYRMTEICDELMSSAGLTGVYNMTYEALYNSTVMWEYKGLDGQIHGPFTSHQIAGWKAQGFLTGSTAVLMRQIRNPLFNANPNGTANGNGAAAHASSTSIYDDDEDDAAPAVASTASAVPPPPRPPQVEEAWVSSDDIDFGEFVILSEHAFDVEATKGHNSSSGSSKAAARDSDGRSGRKKNFSVLEAEAADDGGGSGGRSKRVKFAEEEQAAGSDGEGDEDDEDDDFDMMRGRKGGNRRQQASFEDDDDD